MVGVTARIREKLAAIAFELCYDDLPAEVVHETKRLIIDTVGCAVGGYPGKACAGIRRVCEELGGRAEASILGQTVRTACTHAALANGTMLRYLDANDYYYGRDPAHPSGNLAAVLAVAEREQLSGRDLILGMVIAYEIQLRLCDFAGQPSLWHRGWHHATNMQFSSAAAAARLLGLDLLGIADAMAIAATHNNTLIESMRGDIPSIKASIEATTAKAGVEAALMARHGLTGPAEIFEGKYGWINVVAGDLDASGLTRPIGSRYRIRDSRMKRYTAHALSQAHIESAIAIARENELVPERIAGITLGFAEQVMRQPAMDAAKQMPGTRESADHSPHYLVAVGIIDGACGPAQFTDEKLSSQQMRGLMRRIELAHDARLDALWPDSMAGSVAITMDDGSRYERICEHPPGHPANPIDNAALEEKFLANADGVISEPEAQAIIAAIWNLDSGETLDPLTRALRFGGH